MQLNDQEKGLEDRVIGLCACFLRILFQGIFLVYYITFIMYFKYLGEILIVFVPQLVKY